MGISVGLLNDHCLEKRSMLFWKRGGKEHSCPLGSHFGPRSATTLRMKPNSVEWSWWWHSASPCLEIPEVFIKIFHWAVAVWQCVTRFHTKPQPGVSIPGFMTESRWVIPADTTDWWPCESWHPSTALVKHLNSNREAWPMLLSTWIGLKILAIGVPKIYWHVSSQVAQLLTNWPELTWPAARHSPSLFAAQALYCKCVA